MIFQYLKLNLHVSNEAFDALYPPAIIALANRHWTPVAVARMAAQYLVSRPGEKILDIGSGVGKFCFVGAASTEGHFTGVEQREHFHRLACQIQTAHCLPNLEFVHSNITQVSFERYNSIYYYNPFFENLDKSARLDDTLVINRALYRCYFAYVRQQLEKMPNATKLATYWGDLKQIPSTYKMVSTSFNGLLRMWEKRA